MGSDDPEKKPDRLARIRENQRKSRARRQEHIRELEQKLAAFQEQAHRKDVEHRLAVQTLEAENRKLKNLLSLSGLPSSVVDGYLRAADDPAVAQKVAIPALRKRDAQIPSPGQESSCGPPRPQISEVAHQPAVESPPIAPSTGSAAAPQTPSCGLSRQTICQCSPSDAAESWPASEDVLNTTLCAIAEELISQYNTRGVDMDEIRRKLWAGFSKGVTTEEGCRVQNQILFQVLDEISNN